MGHLKTVGSLPAISTPANSLHKNLCSDNLCIGNICIGNVFADCHFAQKGFGWAIFPAMGNDGADNIYTGNIISISIGNTPEGYLTDGNCFTINHFFAIYASLIFATVAIALHGQSLYGQYFNRRNFLGYF